MRARQAGETGDLFRPARPFAEGDQRCGKDAGEENAHAGTEVPLIDRVADEEDAAERERQSADPDHPAGADALLETFRRLGAGLECFGRNGGAGDQFCRHLRRARGR